MKSQMKASRGLSFRFVSLTYTPLSYCKEGEGQLPILPFFLHEFPIVSTPVVLTGAYKNKGELMISSENLTLYLK